MAPTDANDVDGSPANEIVRSETFARNLHQAMLDRGMSQSDLARALWGETTTPEGRTVAKSRERISVYLRGRTIPTTQTLRSIAEVLGMTPEELAPNVIGAAVDRDNPEFSMSMVAGHSDKVFVRVSKLLPLHYAVEIANIIDRAEKHSKGLLKDDQ